MGGAMGFWYCLLLSSTGCKRGDQTDSEPFQVEPRSNLAEPETHLEEPRSNLAEPRSSLEEPRSSLEEPQISNSFIRAGSKSTPDTNSVQEEAALPPEALANSDLEPDAELHQLPRLGKQFDEENADSYGGEPLSNQLDDDYFSDYDYYPADDYSDYPITMSQSESVPLPGLSTFHRVGRLNVPSFLPGAFALPISEAFNQFDEFGPQKGFKSFSTSIVSGTDQENLEKERLQSESIFSANDDIDYTDFGSEFENFGPPSTSPMVSNNFDLSQDFGQQTNSFSPEPFKSLDQQAQKNRVFHPQSGIQSDPESESYSRRAKQYSERPVNGVDLSEAVENGEGKRCVIKEESVEKLERQPILECTHKNVEKCHYTYVTVFNPQQEEQCEENFEKSCQITFRAEATTETVRKCYRPQRKVCNGQGAQQCRTEYESSCTTRYKELTPGKFVGDTSCERLPVEVCGAGCQVEEGPEECHDKQIDSLVEVPEESCEVQPQKTCRHATKLVPQLTPEQECTQMPIQVCSLRQGTAQVEEVPLRTEWCEERETSSSSSTGYQQQ